uniref:Retrotransposon Copia-like N-terminal domain-containing protein n=1 Tax=Cannabis sativa TaxID=3483 RepID=A0A803PCW7_CANSA
MADPNASTPTQQSDNGGGMPTLEASQQSPAAPAISAAATSQTALPNSFASPFSSTLSQPFSLRLDRNNFPLWKTMVFTIIRGHRLEGFINGQRQCPEQFITTGIPKSTETQFSVNPDYENWLVHDQILMGWLYGSMTEGIASEVMGCQSASSLWAALEELYGGNLRAHMDELRTKLQTVRKGSATMADYLKQKRMWADSLALAGEPYPEKLLVSNVLSGLDVEFLFYSCAD